VHQLFIDFEKAYDSTRREVLFNILTEFDTLMKLLRQIKMCLNRTYREVGEKNISHIFLREGDASHLCL